MSYHLQQSILRRKFIPMRKESNHIPNIYHTTNNTDYHTIQNDNTLELDNINIAFDNMNINTNNISYSSSLSSCSSSISSYCSSSSLSSSSSSNVSSNVSSSFTNIYTQNYIIPSSQIIIFRK